MLPGTTVIVRESVRRSFCYKYFNPFSQKYLESNRRFLHLEQTEKDCSSERVKLLCSKKSLSCRQQMFFKRQKHLLNISKCFLVHKICTTCQKSFRVIEFSPLSRQCISTSCTCMKSENQDDISDLKNDPMVKKFLEEIYDDFKKERMIEKDTVDEMEIKQDEIADHTDIHYDSDSDLVDSVAPKNSELSDWLDYYELSDTEDKGKDISVTDLKHFVKKSAVYKDSEISRKEKGVASSDNEGSGSDLFSNTDSDEEFLLTSSSDSDNEGSGSDLFSNTDSDEEFLLTSSSDSDSRSGSDTDDEQVINSHKNTENDFHKEDDIDLKITRTVMEDLSGQYVELNYGDNFDRYNEDADEYDEYYDKIDRETAVKTEQTEEMINEEIDDFPDDFEETEVDVAPWVPPVPLTRGKDGVFDIDDLVTLLRTENLEDICVMRIPEAYQFGDYMVIASAKSYRHLKAVMANIVKTHKMKKQRRDRYMIVEGLRTSKDWLASDLGNIILHVFLPKTRKLYDLETLWSVGEKFDEKFANPDDRQMDEYSTNEEWLHNLTQGNRE